MFNGILILLEMIPEIMYNTYLLYDGDQVMSELKKVLLIWMAVCIILAGCANKLSATESGVKPEVPPLSTFPETSAAIGENAANTLPPYEFQVKVSEERVLSVILHLEEQKDAYTDKITEVLVYDGDRLLQTISRDDVPATADYALDGLFFSQSSSIGEPDVRDLNFDGAEDFGLLAVQYYPHNVPYCYFLWNDATERFEYQFMAFGMGALEVDKEEKCLIETSIDGAIIYSKYYIFESDGSMNSRVETRNAAIN